MRAGQLRTYGTIQSLTQAGTATGGITETWATFANVWAEIEHLSGTEFFEGAALDREVNVRIRMRYMEGITGDMRFVSETGETYEFRSPPMNIGMRNRMIEIMAAQI